MKRIVIQYAHPFSGIKNSIGERPTAWGEKQQATVRPYPVRDALTAQAYGKRPDQVRRMFLDGKADILPGDGVWLPGETGESPPWKVTDAPQWPRHMEILLERVTA